MKIPLVSVVIPAYNHAGLILETLNSVLNQTFPDYEVIVINDGSPDETGEILASRVASGKIRYIEQVNSGQASARNRGLAAAKGEYVAFLDDDDLWPHDKLEWQVSLLQELPNLLAVAGTAVSFDGNGNIQNAGWCEPVITPARLFCGNPIWSPGQVLIRRSVLLTLGGFDTKIWGADDYDLWFRLSNRGLFAMRNISALSYRLHARNASRQMARLLLACQAVFAKNIRLVPLEERDECMTQACRFLYAAWGHAVSNQAKLDFKKGRIRESLRNVAAALYLATKAPKKSGVAKNILRDLTPGPCLRLLGLDNRRS